jgi:NAD(P)-dependent dehydrogenase (short-subunit alcohol dehydrogenase family)
MLGMTRSLAIELGRDGITVNAIAPGPIETDLFMASSPDGPERASRMVDSIIVGRMGKPEDVAHAACYFLSEKSGFVTGQVLYVCGGTSLGKPPL